MKTYPYIEVKYAARNHEGERICGDVFLSRRVKEEQRTVLVLSDGLGHGVKANVLATLTASMALNFTIEHKNIERTAEIIMNTLPIDSERKISYATFTIVDIEDKGKVRILEYDNPDVKIFRGDELLEFEWERTILDCEKHKGKELRSYSFYPQFEDRIVFRSDGISQSGLGMGTYPFGWGDDNMVEYILLLLKNNPNISADQLAKKIVNTAHKNDLYHAKDDTSCAVVYFREPRKLLLCTGPPYEKENDVILGDEVREFKGKIIACGATTADILSRELDREIEDSFEFYDPDLPPMIAMRYH